MADTDSKFDCELDSYWCGEMREMLKDPFNEIIQNVYIYLFVWNVSHSSESMDVLV